MNWDDDKQARPDALRAAELAGALGEAEQAELDALIALVETEEQERLGPAIARMRATQEVLRRQVQETAFERAIGCFGCPARTVPGRCSLAAS